MEDVAEYRTIVLSNIDILIFVKRKLSGRKRRELSKKMLIRAMDYYDLSFDATVDLHVEDEEGV